MTTIHIMLDLETWGTRPGFDIRSIGACVFDPLTGVQGRYRRDAKDISGYDMGIPNGTFYIATDNPIVSRIEYEKNGVRGQWDGVSEYRKYSLKCDPETVAWWNDQSAEAQAAFADPVDLRDALRRFIVWLNNVIGSDDLTAKTWDNRNVRIWAHGPSFDVSILEAAYHAVGLPVPWHYRAPRDTRTAFDIADVGDHSTFMQQFNHGTAHHALDDAISQARCVCAAYARIVSHARQAFYDGWDGWNANLVNPTRSVHDAWKERFNHNAALKNRRE